MYWNSQSLCFVPDESWMLNQRNPDSPFLYPFLISVNRWYGAAHNAPKLSVR